MVVWGGNNGSGTLNTGGQYALGHLLDDDDDGYSECDGDCNDSNDRIYPTATQLCDGFNNDCDDPGWPSLIGTNEADDDGDTFSECSGDCDDVSVSTYPSAPQLCDGLNNDCNDVTWPTVASSEIDDDGLSISEQLDVTPSVTGCEC